MVLLPDPTPEELEKIARLKGETQDTVIVTPEMYFLAEFGYYFGWPGVLAIENGDITLEKAGQLIAATRKVWYTKLYEQSITGFYANKDGKTFNSGMKPFINKMKVQE